MDFYHVSEYLAAAAPAIAQDRGRAWLTAQQARLQENQAAAVLAELAGWREPEGVAEEAAPVRRC